MKGSWLGYATSRRCISGELEFTLNTASAAYVWVDLRCCTLNRITPMSANMECPCSPFSHQTCQVDVVSQQSPFSFVAYSPWDLDLAMLRNEQDILENGLATCVTYLLALRKKLARNERSLNLDPSPTRTKRKRMEQSKRTLEREIQNRQRDEQAFLNNLQACKTNMYLMGGIWNQSIDVIPTMAECTYSTTQRSCDESTPTEVSWNGWADHTASPFEKLCSNAVVLKEVAPDEQDHHDNSAVQTRSISLRAHEPMLTVSVSQDCIGFKGGRSSLSPEATVFEPIIDATGQDDQPKIKQPEYAKGGNALQRRRVTVASMHSSLKNLSIHTRSGREDEQTQTWYNTTPQRSPRNRTRIKTCERRRSTSL
jgi:hypothetical protein